MKLALHWQIIIALVAATVVGVVFTPQTSILGILLVDIYAFFGTLFMHALTMIIVPLIVSSIVVGVAGMGSEKQLGNLGMKTIAYYLITSLCAILVGLIAVNVATPGLLHGVPAGEQLGLSPHTDTLLAKVEGHKASDVVEVFLRMVPPNIVDAAANGQMLGLIFFSIVFGYFMTSIDKPLADTLRNVWQGISDTMMQLTLWIMKFTPYGVFALVAKTITLTGFNAFLPLAHFLLTVLAAFAVHVFITLPLFLRVFAKVSPQRHFRAMLPAMLTAFSTSSSAATLPLTMECVEKNAGVSHRLSSFVLPLGATVNMDGTALYECVAALFLAQAYGLEMTYVTQFTVVLLALLTSIGVAGIPSASLVAITVILTAIGLPLEGMGIILVTDRILDMFRTAINVFSDSCGAVVIAKLVGEDHILQKTEAVI